MTNPSTRLALWGLCFWAAAAAAALLSGCGGGSGSDTPPLATTPAEPSPLPPAAPPITPTGPAYYFSDCQSGAATGCVPGDNGNAGTSAAAPKRNLSGFSVNALPAGSQLLFARGGAWTWVNLRLENPNVTPTDPLVMDAYGTGAAPQLNAANLGNTSAIDFGTYNNTSNDGGYTLRNVKLDGKGSTTRGLFLIHNLRYVTLESMEITGFEIAIQSQSREPYGVNNIVIRNNNISRNGSMGILGQFKDSLIEGNLFEANNFSGSGFNHGTYLSGHNGEAGHVGENGGTNVTLRNNRYMRNSEVSGVCQGGNMTFHGQMDGVLIEGNTIEHDVAAPGCWAMSITSGYSSPESFRNFIVRNNRIINAGNTAIAVQLAPGIRVEGNVIVNTQTTAQTAISIGLNEYRAGDAVDGNAVVMNNTACYPTPHANSSVLRVTAAPNTTDTHNIMVTGAAASTGNCAR